MDNYVASLQPSSKNKYTGIFEGKNLIFITAEAFSEELIDPELILPTIINRPVQEPSVVNLVISLVCFQ